MNRRSILNTAVINTAVCGIILMPLLQLLFSAASSTNFDGSSMIAVFDAITVRRFFNSVQIALWDVIFSTLFAFPVYCVYLHVNTLWRFLILAVSAVPFTFPAFATASSWMILLSRIEQGEVSRVIWGAHGTLSSWLYSIPGCGFILALHDWTILFLFLVMTTRLTRHQTEAALLYLSWWKTMMSVWIPAWKLPFLCGNGVVFAVALVHFETASLLQIDVYALEIYTRFSTLLNNQDALMLCVPFLFLAMGMSWLFVYIAGFISFQNTGDLRLSGFPAIAVLMALILFAAAVCIPVGGFFAQTNLVEIGVLAWQQSSRIFNSLLYSIMGGLTVVIMGLILGRPARSKQSCLTIVFAFLFFMPGIITAAGVLELRSWLPFVQPSWLGVLTLIYAHICHVGLIGVLAGTLLWQQYGQAQLEYETLNHIPFWTKVQRLYIPSLWKPALAATAAAALLVWSDVAMTVLLHPPGGDTLTVYYYNQMHYGSESRTAAAGVLLMMIPNAAALSILFLLYLPNKMVQTVSKRGSESTVL